MPTETEIRSALEQVKYPGFSRNIVSFGLVKNVEVREGTVDLLLGLTTRDAGVAEQLQKDVETALRGVPGLKTLNLRIESQPAPASSGSPMSEMPLPGVRFSIAVASGKGGVGKSTVAVNLALALQQSGSKVGLLDCDIYGPSIPLMMGVHRKPEVHEDHLVPLNNFGIKLMSMGFIVEEGTPVIWRGPMIMKTVQQFTRHVEWGELDYLVIDLPPGTGDTQLSLTQTLPLTGAVMVTTPQEVALIDVRKAAGMFLKLKVPILGVIENMSYFLCPGDGKRYDIFGTGGGRKEADRLGVPLLGEIPIAPEIRKGGDQGTPLMVAAPDSAQGQAFTAAARALRHHLEEPR
ncbi:MAG: Mrp/NBP35 family ATP-binding protein [Verrucomicrobiae bacterium]|nr:Mrp/NBP35 family ATP-binding protein [Verrucomicrobiae bacterium]